MGTSALIAVDVQNDFIWGRQIGNVDRVSVIDPIVQMAKSYDLVIATMDWHPSDHCSFIRNGGRWPQHCSQGSWGAELVDDIDRIADWIVRKGTHSDREEFSAFADGRLAFALHAYGIEFVTVVGLCTDFCVLQTALDVCAMFDTEVVTAACAGVTAEGAEAAYRTMEDAGILIV